MKISTLIFFILLLVSLFYSFSIPIYTDEIGYKILQSRYFLDNGKAISLLPQCSNDFNLNHPRFQLPFRIFDSVIYSHSVDLLWIRFLGAINYLIILLFMAFFLFQYQKKIEGIEKNSFYRILGWVFLVLSLGLTTQILWINRPEQFQLIFLFSIFILPQLAFFKKHQKTSLFLFIFFIAGAFAYHIKTLFFLPVIFYCGWSLMTSLRGKLLSLISCLLLVFFSFNFTQKFVFCENQSFINYLFSLSMIPYQGLLQNPLYWMPKVFENIINVYQFGQSILFLPTHQSQWFPVVEGVFVKPVFILLNILILFVFLISGFIILNILFKVLFTKKIKNSGFILTLSFSLLMWTAMQIGRNFYESSLFITLYWVLFYLCTQHNINIKNKLNNNKYLFFVIFVASLSQLAVSAHLYFYRAQLEVSENKNKSKWIAPESRKWSIQEIQKFAFNECGLKNNDELENLVIDDLTYYAFNKSRFPYHISYISGFWGQRIPDIRLFLLRKESSGLISYCSHLPQELMVLSKKQEDLCCIPNFKNSMRHLFNFEKLDSKFILNSYSD